MNTDNNSDWLYNKNNNRTPTTSRFSLGSLDNEFVPANNDVIPFQETNEKQDFAEWFISSVYDSRWRSADDDTSLGRHDGTTFRTQLKVIFSHLLIYLAPNDVDVVWHDFIDEETEKAAKT
jgi:hypothetical protein